LRVGRLELDQFIEIGTHGGNLVQFQVRKKAHPQREFVARIGGEHLIQQHDRIAVFGLGDE
jgi:hypothetical protein